MLELDLNDELAARLKTLATEQGTTVDALANEAVRRFFEDKDDYDLAVEVSREGGPTYSLEEVERELGLDRPA